MMDEKLVRAKRRLEKVFVLFNPLLQMKCREKIHDHTSIEQPEWNQPFLRSLRPTILLFP
jgi:hypothetical protein